MTGLDWFLLALVALAFGAAVYKSVDNARKGKHCGGNCSGCSAACGRRKSPPDQSV